ncbi:MAG: hypothetical protein LBE82_10470 [Chitinophagaceae bacterium]|jgi:hypothetical protein|nr:hypothetical protein [Chitinophagaceae bacterium]
MKPLKFHNNPQIFTTGAFLQPMKVTDSEGKEIWVWAVEKFEDSSFYDGEEYNPKEVAESLDELLIDTTGDE